jgi:O-antigen/teichoic acid export membrane protein
MSSGTARSGRRDTGVLALGSAGTGLLAYVVFAMLTRGLASDAAAAVSVLWTYWAFAGAALTFPVQHWITRTVAAGAEGVVRRSAKRVSVAVLACAVVAGGVSWVLRDALFHRGDAWFPVMVALLTIGSALIGVVRGGLSARGRFGAVAVSLLAENGLRCVLVGGLLLLGITDAVAHGLCLVAGQAVVVLWPSAFRYGTAIASSVATTGPFAFLAGAGAGQLVSQAVLTGGPVVLALSGGSAREVTSLFAALALFRAPYMLALGSVSQLTLRATERAVAGETTALRALLRTVVAAGAATCVVAVGLGWWLGPWLLQLVFGDRVDVSSGHAALLALGCAAAITNLVLMVLALAHDRPGQVARAWLAATLVGAVALAALSGGTPLDATVGAFVVAEAAAVLGLLWVAARAIDGPVRPVSPAV